MKLTEFRLGLLGTVAFALGSAALLAVLAWQANSLARLWADWLVASLYVLGLGLGSAVLLALFAVTGARWSDSLRPALATLSSLVPAGALGIALVLLAYPALYAWADPAYAEVRSPFQELWLQRPFFLWRALICVAVWIGMTLVLARAARRDVRPVAFSGLFLLVFAVTFWLASNDWIMSLEPRWSSTIFGVYNFSGLLSAALAALLAYAVFEGGVERSQLRDLGTLVFAFSSFWMYIWFSQYMLIWYVNNPEEAEYFVLRQFDPWQPLFLANLVLNWGIPFTVLLFRRAKENRPLLLLAALSVLLGRWVDLDLMVLPPIARTGPMIEPADVILVPGMLGLALLVPLMRSRAHPPVSCAV